MPPEHLVQRVKRSEPWAEGSYAFTQGQRVPWELCRRKGVWRFASELRQGNPVQTFPSVVCQGPPQVNLSVSGSEGRIKTRPHHQQQNWHSNSQSPTQSIFYCVLSVVSTYLRKAYCLPGLVLLTHYIQISIAILAIFKCLKIFKVWPNELSRNPVASSEGKALRKGRNSIQPLQL